MGERVFSYGTGWFRILGYGFRWVDHRVTRPFFSERNGLGTCIHIGPWCFRWLKREWGGGRAGSEMSQGAKMKRDYRFIIHVSMSDDLKDVTAMIGADPQNPPPAAAIVAAEHMMTCAAMQGDDFERSLALLCAGARSNKVKMFGGNRTDQ